MPTSPNILHAISVCLFTHLQAKYIGTNATSHSGINQMTYFFLLIFDKTLDFMTYYTPTELPVLSKVNFLTNIILRILTVRMRLKFKSCKRATKRLMYLQL